MTLMSRAFYGALLLGVSLTLGCDRQQPAAGDATTAANEPAAPESPRGPVSAMAAPPDQTVVITNTGDVNATLERLSIELRKYVVGSRSVPKNFEDFVSKARVEYPPAPAGKRYKIAGQAVVLDKL